MNLGLDSEAPDTPIGACAAAVKSSYDAYKAWQEFVINQSMGTFTQHELDSMCDKANSIGIWAVDDVSKAYNLVPRGASFVTILSLLKEADSLLQDFEGTEYDATVLYYRMWLLCKCAWEMYGADVFPFYRSAIREPR